MLDRCSLPIVKRLGVARGRNALNDINRKTFKRLPSASPSFRRFRASRVLKTEITKHDQSLTKTKPHPRRAAREILKFERTNYWRSGLLNMAKTLSARHSPPAPAPTTLSASDVHRF